MRSLDASILQMACATTVASSGAWSSSSSSNRNHRNGGGGGGSVIGRMPRTVFPTTTSRIVIADTGRETPHVVGTKEQDLYFKVVNVAGPLRRQVLFYESPRDYCAHFFGRDIDVPGIDAAMERWSARIAALDLETGPNYCGEERYVADVDMDAETDSLIVYV